MNQIFLQILTFHIEYYLLVNFFIMSSFVATLYEPIQKFTIPLFVVFLGLPLAAYSFGELEPNTCLVETHYYPASVINERREYVSYAESRLSQHRDYLKMAKKLNAPNLDKLLEEEQSLINNLHLSENRYKEVSEEYPKNIEYLVVEKVEDRYTLIHASKFIQKDYRFTLAKKHPWDSSGIERSLKLNTQCSLAVMEAAAELKSISMH